MSALSAMDTDHLLTWRRVPTWTLLLPFLLLSRLAVAADCSWVSPEPSWNHYFDGRLGTHDTVRLVLAYDGCKATGTWFDSVKLEDLTVSGILSSDHALSLMLRSADGKAIAKVDGTIELQQSAITGKISGSDRYRGRQVVLKMDRSWNGTDHDVAESVGIVDQAKFDRETLRFWRAVRAHDAVIVSKCLRYPLPVTIYRRGQTPRSLTVRDPETLVHDYDEIFNAYRREAILSHLPRHLIWGFYAHTVMLGGNVVLFDAQGEVISLP